MNNFFKRWSQYIELGNSIPRNAILSILYIIICSFKEDFKFDIYFWIDYLKSLLFWIIILHPILYSIRSKILETDVTNNLNKINQEDKDEETK